MAKGATLKAAIDREKGRDYALEKQRKAEKRAAKKRLLKAQLKAENEAIASEEEIEEAALDPTDDGEGGVSLLENGVGGVGHREEDTGFESGVSSEGEEDEVNLARLIDSESDSDSEVDDEEFATAEEDGVDGGVDADAADEDDIPLSDIDSSDRENADLIPRQRLTINNTPGLTAALNRIRLPYSRLPFSEHQSVTATDPLKIDNVDDDLTRELAFYAQSLASAEKARTLLKKEGVPFTRPTDYFAEMVKSDEQMSLIKAKLVKSAGEKRAAQDARRQRDLKKFGKQVQVAKLQERAAAKRQTLDRIAHLKRKRAGATIGDEGTGEADMFDVGLDEESARPARRSKSDRRPDPSAKRQKRNAQYGFGGQKRGKKRNDARSAADDEGFSVRKMKSSSFGGISKSKSRLGKSRRVGRR